MAAGDSIRFSMFPRTQPPPDFVARVVEAFRSHTDQIATEPRDKGLMSDEVLQVIGPDLARLGFQVESGKGRGQKIERPVFFGENGLPTLKYEIDAYHPDWKCGLEVEAGRALGGGNAIYRDLVQAAVMVDVDVLIIGIPNVYRFLNAGKPAAHRDYEKSRQLAEAIYGHDRLRLPYQLVLIGY